MSLFSKIFGSKKKEVAPPPEPKPVVLVLQETRTNNTITIKGFLSDERILSLQMGELVGTTTDPLLNRLTCTFANVSDADCFDTLKVFNACDGKPISSSFLDITYRRGRDTFTFTDSGVRYSNE